MGNGLKQLCLCGMLTPSTNHVPFVRYLPDQTRIVESSPEEIAPPSGSATTPYTNDVCPDKDRMGSARSKEYTLTRLRG